MGVPLGLQAEVCGGSEIDKELLRVFVAKCKAGGIRWKDDPLTRAEFIGGPALLRIEDAKIRLSEEIANQGDVRLQDDISHIGVLRSRR